MVRRLWLFTFPPLEAARRRQKRRQIACVAALFCLGALVVRSIWRRIGRARRARYGLQTIKISARDAAAMAYAYNHPKGPNEYLKAAAAAYRSETQR